MRSIEAGTSSVGCGERVAVTTTLSTCAPTDVVAANASAPNPLLICASVAGMPKAVFHLLLALFSAAACAQADSALLAKLRQGGYVLFLRHTSTDFSQNDAQMKSFEDCASQRN